MIEFFEVRFLILFCFLGSQKSIEILNNAICNFIDIFDHDEVNQRVLFIDPFGNVIFSDPDFEEGEDEEKPFDQKVYAMRSFRPSTISETYFFNQKVKNQQK